MANRFAFMADANWDKLAQWQSILVVKWDSLKVKHLLSEVVSKWDSC